VPAERADRLVADLHRAGVKDAAVVGRIEEGPGGRIAAEASCRG
jgi:hypothetical protein